MGMEKNSNDMEEGTLEIGMDGEGSRIMYSHNFKVDELLAKGVNVTIYNGQIDIRVALGSGCIQRRRNHQLNSCLEEVTDCKNLKEIFGDEEIEESTKHVDQRVVFPKILRLTMKSLKTFFSKKECEEINLENDTTVIHPFFDEKVHCPSLEKTILSQLDNIQLIWHNKLEANSFCKLEWGGNVMMVEDDDGWWPCSSVVMMVED
ncbi:hypothetical protein Patl1_10706 [Pistacia atlantica]|uniref:Uncharacterized protein n=1 Tax=Pistacia atlantica TaxID=434234 RepID=A0ACC1A6Z6_9ROSI|nr:hypothetical protein Patl1_10706 [Pistacia atlantica]